jgi:ElaB/YqjD/DUF883 family membrane-anchored ribosome-binding protein
MAQEIEIQPRSADAARAEIERTRTRMSETIDEIEDVLLRKKEQFRDTLDVRARIREKPLHAAGIVLGAGLLLGLLTGGGSRPGPSPADDGRASLWEARARRLLAIAREQEDEIDELEAAVADLAEAGDVWVEADWEEAPSRWTELRDALVERIGDFVGEASRAVVEGTRSRR